jgi:homogentisate 1,2-dioxygenase
MGSDEPLRTLERDEELLLSAPHPNPLPIELWREHPPLPVVHFPQRYQAQPFAPPRGVYENTQIRIEWQTMDNRQPFYHRNCDVDEISYQIAGERTLMTELGVIEHRAGEFSRIPRGVAHDNYGRQESHLLFYLPAPVEQLAEPTRTSEAVLPPFPGWQAATVNEAVTECMGTVGHDITVFRADEQRLLEQVYNEKDRLHVLRGAETPGTTWLYATAAARLGVTRLAAGTARDHYRRTLDADEIQYQISGARTVLTQRGVAEVGPGDLIRIPLGIAHASVCTEPVEYLVLQADRELPQIADTARFAQPYSAEHVAELRSKVENIR